MKKIIALLLTLVMVFALCACGQTAAPAPAATDEPAPAEEPAVETVYAVEAGSAGEAAALDNGWQVNSVETQSAALMEVSAGTSDAAIIDLLMAYAMIGEGTSYPDLVTAEELNTEEYGVGCRKGSDLAQYINALFYDCFVDGTFEEIATTYELQGAMIDMPENVYPEDSADSDVAYIKEKGTLIVGITDFAPMDYKNDAGEWIGFDADMAKKLAEALGVEIEFVEINWDNKILELDAKSIDVVWNGMTLTDEVMNAMECSVPYFKNAQVVVVPAA